MHGHEYVPIVISNNNYKNNFFRFLTLPPKTLLLSLTILLFVSSLPFSDTSTKGPSPNENHIKMNIDNFVNPMILF